MNDGLSPKLSIAFAPASMEWIGMGITLNASQRIFEDGFFPEKNY